MANQPRKKIICMLPVKKLSASSIGTLDMCEMKWFLQYIVGMREPTGKAAAIGSICHYIMECIAHSKILRQNGKSYKKDEIVGRVTPKYDLDEWTRKIYTHYSEKENHLEWTDKDFRQVLRNVEKAKIHPLYPENHSSIISPEQFFMMKIDKPWAQYSYLNGKKVDEGHVYANGIIDLIFRDQNGVLNYLDYKFGQPKDWATGKKKDYISIAKDIQLCMYYVAVKEKFPDEDICVNIWYVNHDTVFTDFFGAHQEEILMKKLESVINRLREMEKPDTRYGFHCSFCQFKKTNFANWDRQQLDIDYDKFGGKFPPVDEKACVCDATKTFIKYRGLQTTIENLKGK